jgi:hypothetical protein
MAVTPHTNQIHEVLTLAIGNQTLKSLLVGTYPGLNYAFQSFAWGVEAGGPVAIAQKTMAAIGDGQQKALADPPDEGEQHGARGHTDGEKINFFATANGDKIWVRIRTR